MYICTLFLNELRFIWLQNQILYFGNCFTHIGNYFTHIESAWFILEYLSNYNNTT